MSAIKNTFTVTFTYEALIDAETGEVLETKLLDKKVSNEVKPKNASIKVIEKEDAAPKLYLEENKYHFNQAAIDLLKVKAGDSIDIKYKEGNPIIGKDESFGTAGGNRVTKSFTVAYRGNKREELAKRGTEFTLVPDDKEGLYLLVSDKVQEKLNGDENIVSELSGDDDLPFDLDLDGIVTDEDESINEIDSNIFEL